MSWHKPAKRQRAGELGLITPLRRPVGLSAASSEQSARPDAGTLLFDMLADRAQARSDQDAELQDMRRAQEEQAAALDDSKFQIAKLEVWHGGAGLEAAGAAVARRGGGPEALVGREEAAGATVACNMGARCVCRGAVRHERVPHDDKVGVWKGRHGDARIILP